MYGNALATNITIRMKMDSATRDKRMVFHPYVITEGERPDTIAEHYYGDPYFAWLIYYANEIIDPYFEWPLSQKDFEKLIVKKYGSATVAQEKIEYYKVNWSTDENMLSPGAYSSLPANLKKYWNPMIGYRGAVVSYERKPSDLTVETNMIVELIVASATNFLVGQRVTQTSGGNVVASGFVKYVSSTYITVDKVDGEFSTNYNLSNGTNTTAVISTQVLNLAIPLDELPYWTSVSAYNQEDELNESRKQIYLIDQSYLNQIELELKSLLV